MNPNRRPMSFGLLAVVLLTVQLLTGCSDDGGGDGSDGDTSVSSSAPDTTGGSSSDTSVDSGSASDTDSSDTSGADAADEPVGNCASYTLPASDQSPKAFSDGTNTIELRRGYSVSAQVVEATSADGRYSGEFSLMSGEASFYDGQVTVSIEYELVTGLDGQITSEPVQKAKVCGWSEQ
ncbi:hypothetical protein [Streptomyces sp. NPDC059076]|uniref:hypothetical protein n=2 Tax=Streptomyces TaxID=1883 RepID=UPI0036884B1D